MRGLVVGIADCMVCDDPDAVLITYALGSCIALAIYDPVSCVAGMLHYLLPDSSLNEGKAQQQPYMFADTGIPLLFNQAYRLGAVKSRLEVTAVGGAQVIAASETFNVGKRNQLALRRILEQANVRLHNEEVGGSVSRTLRLEVGTGRVRLQQAVADIEIVFGGSRVDSRART